MTATIADQRDLEHAFAHHQRAKWWVVGEDSTRVHAMVTLVLPAESELQRWSAAEREGRCLVIADADLLDAMLRSPVMQATREVVRVVIDGGADLDRFLLLVATLPDSFHGEILFIRHDGSGHLSTRELTTMRTVKTINDVEVEVYLRWHNLPARPRASYPHEPASNGTTKRLDQ